MQEAARRSPDDCASGELHQAGGCYGRHDDERTLRGVHSPAPHRSGDSRCRHEGWRDTQPAHSGKHARGHHLRRGYGAADERQPGLRRTEVHTQLGREDETPAPPHRRVGQQGSHTDRRRRRRQVGSAARGCWCRRARERQLRVQGCRPYRYDTRSEALPLSKVIAGCPALYKA